jgi:hypothetical protein
MNMGGQEISAFDNCLGVFVASAACEKFHNPIAALAQGA